MSAYYKCFLLLCAAKFTKSSFFLDRVVDELVSTGQLEEENREKVREALLHRHRHHGTKDFDKKLSFPHIRSLGDIVQNKKPEERNNSIHSHNSLMSWLGIQNNSLDSSFNRKESKESKKDSNKKSSSMANENGENEEETNHDQHTKVVFFLSSLFF